MGGGRKPHGAAPKPSQVAVVNGSLHRKTPNCLHMLDKYAPSGAEADERNGNWKRRRLTFKVKVVPYFSKVKRNFYFEDKH